MKDILRFLLGLLAPFLLIGGGALLMGAGAEYEWNILIYAGGALILAGIVWGIFLWMHSTSGIGSFFD